MRSTTVIRAGILFILFNLKWLNVYSENPGIFPVPFDIQYGSGKFYIDERTSILLPEEENEGYEFLAGQIFNEISGKGEQYVPIARKSTFPEKDKFILIGDISNPLVKQYCEQEGLIHKLNALGREGYLLIVKGNSIVVAAKTLNGALYGFESLRQIIIREGEKLFIPEVEVRDSPNFQFRGIKLYLPGRENITFFKRFIKDFAVLYKFNKIILELNANMRFEKHPELNAGAVKFNRYLNLNRLDRPAGVHMEFQNSSHHDNADGGILEKEEVADLVVYMRRFGIEVIPEIPSLTHSYYLLHGHEELAENLAQPFPDTYCPLKPEIYKIYFDVLDEYIEVIDPSIIHIGHDEWRMEKDLCELCRGKDYGRLFADDVIKIHDYLASKGIKTAIWGDHLLEAVTKKDHQEWESSTGYKYNIPGALTPEQVKELIPKDILVFNWFWSNISNDKQVSDSGFEQVYGNFTPGITSWEERTGIKGLLGGAPSSWAATTEMNFGKDQIFNFLGTANLLWSRNQLSMEEISVITQTMIGTIRSNFKGQMSPSHYSEKISPVDLSAHLNSSLTRGIESLNAADLLKRDIRLNNILFMINSTNADKRAVVVTNSEGGQTSVEGIPVGKDVNSIVFLHACARQGKNEMAYRLIHNFEETAELLGWYEVTFEDGFVETVPVRYGINILDWKWRERISLQGKESGAQKYVYEADAVNCSVPDSDTITFFSYEWVNSRPGKNIRHVNLRSVDNAKNENAIILLGISVSEGNK